MHDKSHVFCVACSSVRVHVKCMVLGGALKVPIFTNFTSAFADQ